MAKNEFITSDGNSIIIQNDDRYEVSYSTKNAAIHVKSPDFEECKQLFDYAMTRAGMETEGGKP